MLAKLLKRDELSVEAKPLIAAFINLIVILSTYALLSFIIPGLWHPFDIFFTFLNGSIISISTFLYVCTPAWDIFKSNNTKMMAEALKLEHDWIWRAINIISWVSTIMMISTFFASWTQVILPSIPIEKHTTLASIKIMAMGAIQILHLLIGIYFGIIVQLIDYSWRIRKKIAEL
jgi:hypothetical protein